MFPRWQKHFPNVYASFSGLVTSFTESQKLGLRGVPADRLLLETDSLYLPTKGTKNDNTPHHIRDVAALVAEIRQEPVAAVIAAANDNFRRIFTVLYVPPFGEGMGMPGFSLVFLLP